MSLTFCHAEKPGKAKFVPVIGSNDRRKAVPPTRLYKDSPDVSPTLLSAESAREFQQDAAEGLLEEYLDISRPTLESIETSSTGDAAGTSKRTTKPIEMVTARRERRRSVTFSAALEASHFPAPETPTSAAALVNFTAGQRHRVTMAHFLTDSGAGIPMSSSASASTMVDAMVAKRAVRKVKESLSTTVVPRVRVVDGEIVVDDDAASEAAEVEDDASVSQTMDIVNESTGRHLTSHAFVKTIGNNRWKAQDTEHFYEALSMCGTDFALISLLFPNRSREQVKGKFKVEERQNPGRVAMYLRNRKPLDVTRIEKARTDRQVAKTTDPATTKPQSTPISETRKRGRPRGETIDSLLASPTRQRNSLRSSPVQADGEFVAAKVDIFAASPSPITTPRRSARIAKAAPSQDG